MSDQNPNQPNIISQQVNLLPQSSYKNGVVKLIIEQYQPDHSSTKIETQYDLNQLFPTSSPVQKLVLGTVIRLGTFPTEFIETILTTGSLHCKEYDIQLDKLNPKQFFRVIFRGFRAGEDFLDVIESVNTPTGTITGKGYSFFVEETANYTKAGMSEELFKFFVTNDTDKYSHLLSLLETEIKQKRLSLNQCQTLVEAYTNYRIQIRENLFHQTYTIFRHPGMYVKRYVHVLDSLKEYRTVLKSIWKNLEVEINEEITRLNVDSEIGTGVDFFKNIYKFFQDQELLNNSKAFLEKDYDWFVTKDQHGIVRVTFKISDEIKEHESIFAFPFKKHDGEILYIPLIRFGTCPFFTNRLVNWRAISAAASTTPRDVKKEEVLPSRVINWNKFIREG